jgi:N-acetyl-anhydromuramyl-L-alanine amidase AmpD
MYIFRHSKNAGNHEHTPVMITLHAMAERITWGGYDLDAADFLDEIGLCSHALVKPNGDIIRMRGDNELAWHAKRFNTGNLGIEFLVPGVTSYENFLERIKQPYLNPVQYASGLQQVKDWIALYGIQRVTTHHKLDPGRKEDPGTGFPLEDFLNDLGV